MGDKASILNLNEVTVVAEEPTSTTTETTSTTTTSATTTTLSEPTSTTTETTPTTTTSATTATLSEPTSTTTLSGRNEECCPKKRVGTDIYTLIDSASKDGLDTIECDNNCLYRKRGSTNLDEADKVFCLKSDNMSSLSSSCLGGTSIEQGMTDWSGYLVMENKVVCGDFWDYNAAKVACSDLGLGMPKEVFGSSRYGAPARPFLDVLPLCTGEEDNLDSCKLTKNSECKHPAGVVCRRITKVNESTMLDGLPICADEGFTNKEASALCKEEGYVDGLVNSSETESLTIPTGWNIKCKTENLDNCQTSLCINGSAASFTCSNLSEVELVGGSKPGHGTVLYKGGLVCDDLWDIQDANVVCRELGYTGADNATSHSFFGRSETPFQISQNIRIAYTADEVQCNGNESFLSECALKLKSDCGLAEAAGVMCTLGTDGSGGKKRTKRASAAGVAQLAQTGSDIVGSVLDYFDKKEKEKQAYLKERPDQVDISSAGVELKLDHGKGYMDLGGEFQSGGLDLKIQDIPN